MIRWRIDEMYSGKCLNGKKSIIDSIESRQMDSYNNIVLYARTHTYTFIE